MRSSLKYLSFALLLSTVATRAEAQLLTGYAPVMTGPQTEEPQAQEFQVQEPQASVSAPEPEGYTPVMTAPAGAVYDRQAALEQPSSVALPEYQPSLTAPVYTSSANSSPVDRALPSASKESAPVDLQANAMSHDDRNNIITAEGDVMIVQAGRILRADEVDYNVGTDTVHAKGNVVLNEESGNIHLADEVTYNDELQNGTVDNLRSTLVDGSRFNAETGERQDGKVTIMHDAFYTPCEPCKENPDAPPAWDIVASRVTHDEEEHRVSYRNARMEVLGVPVAWTPYFSHPDGTVKQKSGFLSPSAGYKSSLGTFVEGKYYWGIAPDQDATVGLRVMTEESPLLTSEYRKRWDNASLKLRGGITESGHKDQTAGQVVNEDKELRGHVFANGLWDINDKWRSGVNVKWTSDDQYMRQYDFTDDDVLENELYAERFSGRDYLSARVIAYQDIRVKDYQVDQPDVLPEIVASFKGEPGALPVLKGQWNLDASMLGLMRDNDGQDVNRFGLGLGWERRLVSDYGFLTTVEAKARGDFYHINDDATVTPGSGQSTSSSASRFFPQLQVKTSYPVARTFENMQARIEPIVSLTAAPNISYSNRIPNEDSINAQIDASNLFEANRFPGIDRVEDQSRITYGVRSGLFGFGGSSIDTFLGQSYRFASDDNPFAVGSGLENQSSDVVGQVSGRYGQTYNLDYRFQLASSNMASQRHEIEAGADWNRLRLNAGYLYARGLPGTEISDSREQLHGDAQLYLSQDWRVRAGATQDFGADEGLRKVYGGLDYLGQCIFLSLTGQKNYTTDASGDGGTEILFRIGLKNLGEFEESSLRPAASSE